MNDYRGIDERIVKRVRMHAKMLYHKVLEKSIDDLEQELMYCVFKNIHKFNPNIGIFEHFLSKILFCASRNILKMQLRHFIPSSETSVESLQMTDGSIDFKGKVDNLPHRYRLIYSLLNQYSIIDIAKIMAVSRATIHRNLKHIRNFLEVNNHSYAKSNFLIRSKFKMKNLSVIETSNIKELSELAMYDLADLNDQVAKLLSHAKDLKTKLDDALALRFSETVNANLRQENRDTGTTKFIENGFRITAEVPKKVTWDAEQMEEIIKKIPEDKCKSIVKTTYVIDERRYSQLSYEYKLLFQPARTVTPGKMRFQITLPEDQHDVGSGNF